MSAATTHRRIAVGVAGGALAVAALVVGTTALGATTAGHDTTPARPALLTPSDGALHLDGGVVAQMKGECNGHECFHVPPTHPDKVHVTAGKVVILHSGTSHLFDALSAVPLGNTRGTIALRTNGDQLLTAGTPAGKYLVTMTGRGSRAMWQFELVVTSAARAHPAHHTQLHQHATGKERTLRHPPTAAQH